MARRSRDGEGQKGSDYIKIKLESPPILRGTEKQQLSSLYSYLYRLTELLNLALDSLSAKESPLSQSSDQSPKALFNSIKRLICSSKEVFDSVYNELLPRFQQLFPSLDSFRQLSSKQDTDRQSLQEGIESCQDEISQTAEEFHEALSNFVEMENFTIRRWDENYTELWASLDPEQSSHLLPIAFEAACCIPEGAVSGSTLTLADGLGSIYIFGKEIR